MNVKNREKTTFFSYLSPSSHGAASLPPLDLLLPLTHPIIQCCQQSTLPPVKNNWRRMVSWRMGRIKRNFFPSYLCASHPAPFVCRRHSPALPFTAADLDEWLVVCQDFLNLVTFPIGKVCHWLNAKHNLTPLKLEQF